MIRSKPHQIDTTGAAEGNVLVVRSGDLTYEPPPAGGGGAATVVLLDSGAPVPTGTPAGAILFEKTDVGTGTVEVGVLLIDNGATVPAGTAVGTIIIEKSV